MKKRKQQEIHMRVFDDDAKLVDRMKKRCNSVGIRYSTLILRLLASNEQMVVDAEKWRSK